LDGGFLFAYDILIPKSISSSTPPAGVGRGPCSLTFVIPLLITFSTTRYDKPCSLTSSPVQFDLSYLPKSKEFPDPRGSESEVIRMTYYIGSYYIPLGLFPDRQGGAISKISGKWTLIHTRDSPGGQARPSGENTRSRLGQEVLWIFL
jgi:hypothetical protein